MYDVHIICKRYVGNYVVWYHMIYQTIPGIRYDNLVIHTNVHVQHVHTCPYIHVIHPMWHRKLVTIYAGGAATSGGADIAVPKSYPILVYFVSTELPPLATGVSALGEVQSIQQ